MACHPEGPDRGHELHVAESHGFPRQHQFGGVGSEVGFVGWNEGVGADDERGLVQADFRLDVTAVGEFHVAPDHSDGVGLPVEDIAEGDGAVGEQDAVLVEHDAGAGGDGNAFASEEEFAEADDAVDDAESDGDAERAALEGFPGGESGVQAGDDG